MEYGITSFLYQRTRPFHNERLYELLERNFLLDIRPFTSGRDLNDHDHDHEPETKDSLSESEAHLMNAIEDKQED